MNILVTGGAGYVGSKLVRNLVGLGHNVTVIDNLSLSSPEILSDEEKKIKFIRGDLRDSNDVMNALENVELVYHLAGPFFINLFTEQPVESFDSTVRGFINLLESMRRLNVRKLVYASSSGVYGEQPLPLREDYIPKPIYLRALSRKFVEELAALYAKDYGFKITGFRPFTIYGDDEQLRGRAASSISVFVWSMKKGERPKIWGDGKQTRDFIHVEDVVRAYLIAMKKEFNHEIFNVAVGQEISSNELVEIINNILGTKIEPIYIPLPPERTIYGRRSVASIKKAEDLMGFKAEIGIHDGVARVIKENSD